MLPETVIWDQITLTNRDTYSDGAEYVQFGIRLPMGGATIYTLAGAVNPDTGLWEWNDYSAQFQQLVIIEPATLDYLATLPYPNAITIKLINFASSGLVSVQYVCGRIGTSYSYNLDVVIPKHPSTLHIPTTTPRTYPPAYDRPRQARRAK